MIRVGAVSLGWKGVPLPRVLADLAAMGGEHLELNASAGLHDGLVLDRDSIPRVRRWASDAGIVIGAVSGYNDFAQTDSAALEREVRRLISACEVASELGAPIVRAFAGDPKADAELGELRPAIVEGFRRAAPRAAALGVTLAIENHGRLVNDGPLLAAIVHDVDAANVRLTLDTGNFAWAGHDAARTRSDIDAVMPFAANVQVKDGIWRGGLFEFVPVGDGELEIAATVRRLAEHGYDGPISSEYEGAGDFLAGTRRSVERLLAARAAASHPDRGIAEDAASR